MKAACDPTTLTVHYWDGAHPVPGDGLETGTGRRYMIQAVKLREKGARTVGTLECVVLPKDESIPGVLHTWSWSPRLRRY